jgi:hypothetical protein
MRRTLSRPLALTAAAASVPAVLAGALTAAASADAAAVPACRGALIHVSHGVTQGATGHSYMPLFFKNIGQTACSLRGYPGLDALGGYGSVLKHAAREVGPTPGVRTIVLQSFLTASALVTYNNFTAQGGSCRHSSAIAVTPPNTSTTHYMPVSVNLCGLAVFPVVKGTSGV